MQLRAPGEKIPAERFHRELPPLFGSGCALPACPAQGFRDLEIGNAAWEALEPRGYNTHQGFPCELHISLFLAHKSLAMHFLMAFKPVG